MINKNKITNNENLLESIEEDMEVYTRDGDKLGEVKYVHFGVSEAEVDDIQDGPDNFIEILADSFDTDTMPRELQERLYRNGFVRVNTGLLSADGLVMPDQIETVSEDSITLSVDKDEVFKL